jgi:OOP family OmpA-OmpF porin
MGIGLGFSKLGPRNEGKDGAHGDRPGAAKLYGGYRLTDTWGVEAGWAQLGRVHNDTAAQDGSKAHHNGQARSLYLAGTGGVALGQGFSLTGKAGLSLGRVSAKESGDTNFTLGGNKASPLLGIGAEYKLNRNIALTFDLDGYGKVSDKVKAGTATLGARYSF